MALINKQIVETAVAFQEKSAPWEEEEATEMNLTRAPTETATLVAPAVKTQPQTSDFDEAGMCGLESGYRMFPVIHLDNTDYVFIDSEEMVYGYKIECRFLESKRRYVWRLIPVEAAATDMIYSTDGIIDSAGKAVEERLKDARLRGKTIDGPIIYADAKVVLIAPGTEQDGEIRILSLPPTAGSTLRAKIENLGAKYELSSAKAMREKANNMKLTCTVGASRGKTGQKYRPWLFQFSDLT
jgi:hypothetical protein